MLITPGEYSVIGKKEIYQEVYDAYSPLFGSPIADKLHLVLKSIKGK